MMNDPPIHLSNLKICKRVPNTEPSVTVPVWITQSSLDGLNSIIHTLKGLELSGRGSLDGSFELTMFYRTLRDCIRKAEQESEGNNT